MGSQVRVHWTTSSQTNDGLPLKGPITAELCREVGPRPNAPAARLTACAPVARLTVTPGRQRGDRRSSRRRCRPIPSGC